MKRFSLLYLLAILYPSLALAAPVHIAGQVMNKSTNRPLTGATVQLVRPDGEEDGGKVLATVRSGAVGRFDFGTRELAGDDLLIGRVTFQGYSYETPAYDGAARLKEMGFNVQPGNVTIPVFEATTEPPEMEFLVHHLAIESTDTGLKCIERIVVVNPSNKTFIGIGPRRSTVLLDIPKGARDVKLDPKITGAKLVKTADRYAVAKPIMPAASSVRNTIIVEYSMDWPGKLPWQRSLDLSHEVQYPTRFFFVARETDDEELQVKSPKLQPDSVAPVPIGGQQEQRIVNAIMQPKGAAGEGGDTAHEHKEGESAAEHAAHGGAPDHPLHAGDPLKITVERPVSNMFWAFLGLFSLLLLFVPVALLRGPRRGQTASQTTFEPSFKTGEPVYGPSVIAGTSLPLAQTGVMQLPQTRALAGEIAQLDEAWEAGQVEEAEYLQKRAGKKRELVTLMLANR